MATKLSAEQLISARVEHLNMIQGIVSRLATFSANAKNFCVTVVAALLGLAFQQDLPSLLLTAPFAVIAFASLDVYYLAQERRFRTFYRQVVDRPLADAGDLDLTPAKLTLSDYGAGIRSFSTGGYYLLLLIVGAALLTIADDRTEQNGLGKATGGPVRSAATKSDSVRNSERAERTAELGTPGPVQNIAESAAERRDVRKPVAGPNK